MYKNKDPLFRFFRFFRFFRLSCIHTYAYFGTPYVVCLRTKSQQCAARSSLSAPLVDGPCVPDQQQAVSAAPVWLWLWSSVLRGGEAGRQEIQPGHHGGVCSTAASGAGMALREDPLSLLRASAEGSCAVHVVCLSCRGTTQRAKSHRTKQKRWERRGDVADKI